MNSNLLPIRNGTAVLCKLVTSRRLKNHIRIQQQKPGLASKLQICPDWSHCNWCHFIKQFYIFINCQTVYCITFKSFSDPLRNLDSLHCKFDFHHSRCWSMGEHSTKRDINSVELLILSTSRDSTAACGSGQGRMSMLKYGNTSDIRLISRIQAGYQLRRPVELLIISDTHVRSSMWTWSGLC